MDLKIGDKISYYRKKLKLTQEKLAESLGVSNAAVSKWESGISYPDITLLPNLALLFGVSIDTLFELDLRNDSLIEIRKNAKELINKGKHQDAILFLKEQLLKYPNDYDLNVLIARALLTKGLNSEPQNKELVIEAIRYFDKAILLDNEGKNRESLVQNKSFALGAIGEYKEAIDELLKLNNNQHTIQIADYLIKLGETKKGMVMIQNYFSDFVFSFPWLVGNLKECFEAEGRTKEAFDLVKMNAYFREYLTFSEKSNYYNFLCSRDFLDLAKEAKKNKDLEEMWKALKKSVNNALKFDNEPDFRVSRVHFLRNLEGTYDNGNQRASGYILESIKTDFNEFENYPEYASLVNELENK